MLSASRAPNCFFGASKFSPPLPSTPISEEPLSTLISSLELELGLEVGPNS